MTLPEFPEPVAGNAGTGGAPARQAALKFDPMLVTRLRAAHTALSTRIADLFSALEREAAATARTVEECARQFGAIRQIETLWLYPLLAQAVQSDAEARAQFAELRLVGLILARRASRGFDELQQAVRGEVFVLDTAVRLSKAFAKYSSHSERAIYPLYELIGPQRQDAAQVA